MRELDANDLRALIRLIPPVRTLREDVEKGLHLETFAGSGDLVVRTLQALREQIYHITQDAYIAALEPDVDESSKDRTKFSQVLLITGQLLAFLEQQTGTAGIGGERRGNYHVQTAPHIDLNMGDMIGGQADRLMDVIGSAMRYVKAPKPPTPPTPPRPPRGPKTKHDIMYDYDEDDDDE